MSLIVQKFGGTSVANTERIFNVSDIVTPLCVFTMHEGELILKSVHPTSSIEEVAANTGFPIRYFSIEQTPPPTSEELRALREIDPMDYRSIEFR